MFFTYIFVITKVTHIYFYRYKNDLHIFVSSNGVKKMSKKLFLICKKILRVYLIFLIYDGFFKSTSNLMYFFIYFYFIFKNMRSKIKSLE